MPETVLRAIVGLGNPGTRHARTRHNAGFWFADRVAAEFGGTFRKEARFHGHVADVTVAGQPLRVLKPATYMNHSGQAVRALLDYLKLEPGAILVAHDELDHPPGVARLKVSGGHGGHNGLRDVHDHIGPDYRRLRIGIGHPGIRDEVLEYVLKRPGKEDDDRIRETIEAAVATLPVIIEKGWERGVNRLHSLTKAPPGEDGADGEPEA